MTAITKYDRLEATGLWRASPDKQRVDVVVCIGDATLTIKDMRDQALTHWSLAAIERANPGKRPALFHPEGDTTETLEIADDEDEMIRAIEKLRKAGERARNARYDFACHIRRFFASTFSRSVDVRVRTCVCP